MSTGGTPFQQPTSAADDYTKLVFVFQQLLRGLATATIVRVEACSNSGGLSPVGTVDVTPLVNQVDGAGAPVPHTTIYGLPYQRAQGGANAVILDPVKGDLGICVFASRDISSVKAAKGQANPGSARTFDYADGMYIGGLLNGVPSQYVRFFAGGIDIVSPGTVTVRGAHIVLDGPVHGTAAAVFDGDVTAEGTSLHTHVHTGVQSGGSDTGPPA